MLFARKQRDTGLEEEEKQVTLLPQASPVVVHIGQKKLDEYIEQTERLNFSPAVLTREKLVLFLQTNNHGVYNYDEVSAHLTSKFGEVGQNQYYNQTWGWRPLTASDVDQSDLTLWDNRGNGDGCKNGEFAFEGTYQAEIPFEVLSFVETVKKAVPEIFFFVSDAPSRREREVAKDPFLALTLPGIEEMIVVFQWDEPKFFGTKSTLV